MDEAKLCSIALRLADVRFWRVMVAPPVTLARAAQIQLCFEVFAYCLVRQRAFDVVAQKQAEQRRLQHSQPDLIIISQKISYMLLVFDTDVIVSAMRSPTGASAELIRRVRQGALSMGVSVALALEYEAVCLRAEHVGAAGLLQQDALIFVDAVVAMAKPIAVHYHWRPQLRDPSDEMVLELAVNAKANALLTFNVRHFQPAAAAFGLQVQRPGEFLRSLS